MCSHGILVYLILWIELFAFILVVSGHTKQYFALCCSHFIFYRVQLQILRCKAVPCPQAISSCLSDACRLDLKQIITYINMVILSWYHILLTFSEKNAVTVRKRNTHRNVSTVLFWARVRK